MPVGAQVVSFDRNAWLNACRERLAGYEPADRDAAIAAIGGPALGYATGRDHCEGYLDWYMARATSGATAMPQQYAQQYMLVQVTVTGTQPHGEQ
jgi:hypothetical protein